MRFLIINGPNLNLLGKREPDIYGAEGLSELELRLRSKFPKCEFEFFQSNIEGEMVNAINRAFDGTYNGVVINPGAYTHYSIAIRDAIAALPIPVVEVHLTNTHAREEFRKHSVVAPVCKGVILGFGLTSYELAIQFLSSKRL